MNKQFQCLNWFSYVLNLSWGQRSSSVSGAQVCPLVGAESSGSTGRTGADAAQGGGGHKDSLQPADGERLESHGHKDRSAGEEQDHSAGWQHLNFFCGLT